MHSVSCVAPPDATPEEAKVEALNYGWGGKELPITSEVKACENKSLLATYASPPLVISSGLCGSCRRKTDPIALCACKRCLEAIYTCTNT